MVQILMLNTLVSDFAKALKAVDTDRPIAISGTTKRAYQAGIGPHTETATLQLIKEKLIVLDENMYRHIETGIPYPKSPKQKCDWRWTSPSNEVFMIEAKMMRLMGDNAKPNDNILTHILSPYPQQRSALTDCQKLIASGFVGTPTILIYGYEYEGYPLEPVIDAFEYLASKTALLSQRCTATFSDLTHPVHQSGAVYAWTVQALRPS
jgi:hypothetical protein